MNRERVEAGRAKKLLWSVAIAIALFLGPNALGLIASQFPHVFKTSVDLFYSARLELLPIPVTALVGLVVVYVLLTRKRRRKRREEWARSMPDAGGRRLLPPLEIVLLEIGNFTFLAFAFILVVLTLGLLFFALRRLVTYSPLVATNLAVSLGAAVVAMLFILWSQRLKGRSWSGALDRWLRWSFLLAIATAGFGAVGSWRSTGLLRIDLAASQVSVQVLTTLYVASLLCLVLATAGRTIVADVSSNRFNAWVGPSLFLAWMGSLGVLTLFLDGTFLTLYGHIARA